MSLLDEVCRVVPPEPPGVKLHVIARRLEGMLLDRPDQATLRKSIRAGVNGGRLQAMPKRDEQGWSLRIWRTA